MQTGRIIRTRTMLPDVNRKDVMNVLHSVTHENFSVAAGLRNPSKCQFGIGQQMYTVRVCNSLKRRNYILSQLSKTMSGHQIQFRNCNFFQRSNSCFSHWASFQPECTTQSQHMHIEMHRKNQVFELRWADAVNKIDIWEF